MPRTLQHGHWYPAALAGAVGRLLPHCIEPAAQLARFSRTAIGPTGDTVPGPLGLRCLCAALYPTRGTTHLPLANRRKPQHPGLPSVEREAGLS